MTTIESTLTLILNVLYKYTFSAPPGRKRSRVCIIYLFSVSTVTKP